MNSFAGFYVRLADGKTTNVGRVEISQDGKRWGTVCGYWTDYEAHVVCRELGYESGKVSRDIVIVIRIHSRSDTYKRVPLNTDVDMHKARTHKARTHKARTHVIS